MEQLPYEMVEHILTFLPLETLCAMWDVSRMMRKVMMNSRAHLFRDITLGMIMDLVQKHGQSTLSNFLITFPQIDTNKIV
jgi:hypothetical protein